MKKIPLCLPAIGNEEIRAVEEVLKSGWMAHGQKNHEFEDLFKEYIGVKHAITMNSCTSALYLAIKAMEITGEVITPSFTFVATLNAIILAGATPVMVDIERETRNISPNSIEEAITEKTEAIMVVHYAGLPADMPAIIEIANKHNLRIIEDSAECLGGSYNGIKAGAYGVGCFSFFPTKNITTGEGGMLTTNDDTLAANIKSLCAHGIDSTTFAREKADKPWVRIASMYGYNFRLSNVLAAIGVEQMKKVDLLLTKRKDIAERYIRNLQHLGTISFQDIPEGFINSWQMFTILVDPAIRDNLLKYLNKKGVGASVHFDPPAHLQSPYKDLRRAASLSVTEAVALSIISLPIYPAMSNDDVDFVCETIQNYSQLQ
jgi:perosamine synthetase